MKLKEAIKEMKSLSPSETAVETILKALENSRSEEMQEHWSIEQYREYQKNKGKKSKYGAVKTSIDGHTFDSKKEADYYCELKLRLQCGDIKGFCMQPTFILAQGLKYKADFIVFNKDGTTEIIDTKGFKTKEYIAKKKIFEDKFDLKIKEI